MVLLPLDIETMNLIKTALGRFRLIALLEGISFIALLGIAVPLKHIYGYEEATQEVGMAHGVLFILYVVSLIPLKEKLNWTWNQTALAFAAAIFPFGTFVAEYRWFRKI